MLKLDGKTEVDTKNLDRYIKQLEELYSLDVQVGFFNDLHYSGLTAAALMYVHEFGLGNLPVRNVMLSSAMAFRYQSANLFKRVYKDVVAGKDVRQALKQIGLTFVETIRFTIDAGLFSNPTVSKAWAAYKGFEDAMIHYGDLRDMARFEIVKNSKNKLRLERF